MPELVASDGVRLHVSVDGPDDAPTVVLVHGLAASVAIGFGATGVLDRLVGGGLRVVAYDARGHGRSDAPHDPDRYGDARTAADLAEVVAAYAGPSAIVAGYSMGSATILMALASGLVVRGAVLGAAASAVLGWTEADAAQAEHAVAILEGRQEPGVMQWWVDFLAATGADQLALAAYLRGLHPVVDDWQAITLPIVFASGTDDPTVAPRAELAARLPHAGFVDLTGDHVTAAADPTFTDIILRMAFGD